jgi:hypothetical protein
MTAHLGQALPTPLIVARSADGGSTWPVQQVGPATDNGINSQPDGCTVRTDSHGNVYVFGVGTRGGTSFEMMYKSRRLSLRTGTTVARPAPQADCPATFGNSDIFGAAVTDPTP